MFYFAFPRLVFPSLCLALPHVLSCRVLSHLALLLMLSFFRDSLQYNLSCRLITHSSLSESIHIHIQCQHY